MSNVRAWIEDPVSITFVDHFIINIVVGGIERTMLGANIEFEDG